MAEQVIVSGADVMSGMPCFRGTRVPFQNLIGSPEGRPFPLDVYQQYARALAQHIRPLPAMPS